MPDNLESVRVVDRRLFCESIGAPSFEGSAANKIFQRTAQEAYVVTLPRLEYLGMLYKIWSENAVESTEWMNVSYSRPLHVSLTSLLDGETT